MASPPNRDFIEKVKRLRATKLGQRDVVPIQAVGEKKPPSWFGSWTDYRDGNKPRLTDEQLEAVLSNPDVGRAAIMLSKASFVIDVEGEGLPVQQILEQRMSHGLSDKVRNTRTTITPNGRHKHLLLSPQAYPDGIDEILCWILQPEGSDGTSKKTRRKAGEHAAGSGELRVLSQSKYAIEVGDGYEVMNPEREAAVELTKEESTEIVELYRAFKEQNDVIRMMINGEKNESLLKYWHSESSLRHDIAFGLAGTLWHTKVPENFACDLVYYICKVTKDEELEDRLWCVRDTYKNGRAGNDIRGLTKLLPALDGNKEILQRLYEGLETLGYKITRSSVTFKGSPSAKKYFGSVDDIEGGAAADPREGFRGGGSKADLVVDACMPYVKDLFVDKFDVPFATIEINNRLETVGIRKHKFKLWARKVYYDDVGEVVPQQAMESALGLLESKAAYSDKKKVLALRVSDGYIDTSSQTAEGSAAQQAVNIQPTRIYYDLSNKNQQIVEITSEGWSIKESNEVSQMFYRLQGQQPQVIPTKDYPENIFDQFMDLVNTVVKDADGTELPEETKKMRMLLKCYIVALLVPNIDRVILLLYGEQGSAKTAFLELVKMLVDPSGALTLVVPRSIAEIVQQLSHNFIAYYDNVSIIKDWLSDVFCRAATGTGFTKRQLYTDDDDIIYEFIRSVGISAIHLPGSKPDMLDRSLIAKFSYIRKDLRRKKKEDILPIFYQLRSQLLGYIFDILAKALKMKSQGGIKLDTRSRMADWEEWCEIIARCMGYKPMEFINAYNDNTKLQSDLVLEDRPVARAMVKLVQSLEEGAEWTGLTSRLLREFDEIAATQLDLNTKSEKLWPKSPSALSRRIGEIRATLRELGIEIYETQDSKTRIKTLHIRRKEEVSTMPPVPLVPPEPESSSKSESEIPRSEDNIKDMSSGTNDTSGTLHTSHSTAALDYFDIDKVEIVNLHTSTGFPKCDAYIGRNWNESYGPRPLIGANGELGNPFVIGRDGTLKEVLAKYDEWLWHGSELVNGYDPKEYRRKALELLPGCYKWGCHCKPETCHGDILKKYVKRQLQIRRARQTYKLKHTEDSTKGGDTK